MPTTSKYIMLKPKNSRVIICHAIDPNRYKHTVAPAGETDSGAIRMVKDFQAYFPEHAKSITDKETLMRLVSISAEVREWYKMWQKSEANATSFPDWLDKSKEKDLNDFDQLAAARAELAEKEKAWSKRIADAAAAMKATVKTVDDERQTYVKQLNPLLKINLITISQLPIPDQVALASVTSDVERKKKARVLIKAYQIKLKKSLDDGKFEDPFK